jgi:DNA repair exonuclease SbcCD nuclease subunit
MLADALRSASAEAGRFNILMLHTDVEGQVNRPNLPAVPVATLKELKHLVGYVALGHTHKRFEIDNWAFNPGSLEACSIDEYKEERGAFLVEVDDAYNVKAKHLRDYRQRPFQRLSFDVTGAADAEAVYVGVMETTGREARPFDPNGDALAPIIEVTLRGRLGFKNSLLEIKRIREEVQQRTGALHVMLRNQSVPVEYAIAAGMDAQAPRQERERRIIQDLIARDNRYKHRAEEMAELVIEAKRLALTNEPPDKILDLIAQKLDGPPAPIEAEQQQQLAPGAELEHAPTATALGAIERNATAKV